MQPSHECLAIIKQFEGFRPTAYRDSRGVWTIGYGHTSPYEAYEGNTATLAQADVWLEEDAAFASNAVNRLVTAPMAQNQFDALVSLVFNIGVGNFEESTLLRDLNDGEYGLAADQFLVWKRAGSDRTALLRRREAERALFITPQ